MTPFIPVTNGLTALANAIAHAEGFGPPEAIPTKANNPGDLVEPWRHLPSLGPEKVTVFPTLEEGWAAITGELHLIEAGLSHVYALNMTIEQMASKWTRTEQTAWAENVADALTSLGYPPHGATRLTTLQEILE